ncbi:hypothetical protein ACIBJE_20510 [Micromonospora sp. NPDC050187]|uniref:hypothetical protein n=1 Tax=Micromonospora sp. NPDC050187 TaxID=3364277 RepID=UPI0037B3E11D
MKRAQTRDLARPYALRPPLADLLDEGGDLGRARRVSRRRGSPAVQQRPVPGQAVVALPAQFRHP